MEITFKGNKTKTTRGHRVTESVSSTVSIESKGKNIFETLTGITGLINSESITRFIVKNKEELNAKNECDWTPLYRTIIYEKEKATENLLKMGADPNIQCNMGETALYQAIEMEKVGQADILLKFGADPNLGRIDGWRPLHAAVLKGNIALVESLLLAGADPNAKNKLFLQTPVHFAIKHNVNPSILLLLVGHNGSLHQKDNSGKKPLDYAETNEMKEALSKLKTQREEAFLTPQKERMISIYSNSVNTAANFELKAANQLSTLTKDFNNNFEVARESQTFNNNYAGNNNSCFDTMGGAGVKPFNTGLTPHNMNHNISNFNSSFNPSPYKSPTKTTNYIFKKLVIKTASDNKGRTQKISTTKRKHYIELDENNLPKNRSFSPSENERNDTFGNNFTLDHKLSFVTRDHSKVNSPDGKISELNPLDTVYSNYNTGNVLTTNGMKESKEKREEISHVMQYINSEQTGMHISEEGAKVSRENFNLEELDINEEDCDVESEEGNEDDLEYSPSRRSFRISDIGQDTSRNRDNFSSERKNEVNRKLNFNAQVISQSNKTNKTKKIKYHKEKREDANQTNFCSSLRKDRKMIHLNTCNQTMQYVNSNPNVQFPRMRTETSPEYIRKLNFTNLADEPSPMERQCNRNNYCPSHTHSHTTLYHPRKGQTAYNSTRNTSVVYLPEERLNRKKRIYLNETVNPHDISNKTIIHYGTVESTGHCNQCCNRESQLNHNTFNSPANLTNFKKKESSLSELTNRNSPCVETIYAACETNRSNISAKDTKKLLDWLNSIGLLGYYDNFLEKGLFSIDKLVHLMTNAETKLTYGDVESMGIRKPGHVFRLLVKLEVDAKLVDESLYQLLVARNRNNPFYQSNISKCQLRFSTEKNVCCGGIGRIESEVSKTYDLITWLKKVNLPHLRKNFIHNGFDSVGFFILQMYSSYPVDDLVLEDALHIYNKKDRKVLLSELAKEMKSLNKRVFNISQEEMKMSSSMKFEKDSVDEGCKLCLIY